MPTAVHDPTDLWPPKIIVRVGVHDDRGRRLGRVVKLLANRDVSYTTISMIVGSPAGSGNAYFRLTSPFSSREAS